MQQKRPEILARNPKNLTLLLREENVEPEYHGDKTMQYRRKVLRATLGIFLSKSEYIREKVDANMQRWRDEAEAKPRSRIEVYAGDWGEVTLALTKQTGATYAVLNMANAYVPGGGYLDGMVAQEENMYRRTNCHLAISEEEVYLSKENGKLVQRYYKESSDLVNGQNGLVAFDQNPRTCIRGPEVRRKNGSIDQAKSYQLLHKDSWFQFYELRSAAVDLRIPGSNDFKTLSAEEEVKNIADMRNRIRAQLQTLINHKIKHAVLSAFGCGAFGQKAEQVAQLYREEISRIEEEFSYQFEHLAFAIYYPGYGPNNYETFKQILSPDMEDSLPPDCELDNLHPQDSEDLEETSALVFKAQDDNLAPEIKTALVSDPRNDNLALEIESALVSDPRDDNLAPEIKTALTKLQNAIAAVRQQSGDKHQQILKQINEKTEQLMSTKEPRSDEDLKHLLQEYRDFARNSVLGHPEPGLKRIAKAMLVLAAAVGAAIGLVTTGVLSFGLIPAAAVGAGIGLGLGGLSYYRGRQKGLSKKMDKLAEEIISLGSKKKI